MRLFSKALSILDFIVPPRVVRAHCDVPCGIYDATPAMLAAATLERMVEKILALPKDTELSTRNSFVRMVAVKEQHAELCKRELLILWTDFFKPEHVEMFPQLHETFWAAAKLCSKNKQSIDASAAKELKDAVAHIAEMFAQVKAQAAK